MNKKIVSLITALTLSVGFVSADTVSLNTNGSDILKDTQTGAAINVIEKQLTSVGGTGTLVDGGGTVGNPNAGSNGVSSALGYLTPTGDFGYMGLSEFHVKYNGMDSYGKMHTYADDLGIFSTKPAGTKDTDKFFECINIELYDRVKASFLNASQKGGTLRNKLDSISGDDIMAGQKNGKKIFIQETKDGRKFIALTMYLRWMYDTNNGYNKIASIKFNPVLNNSYSMGPYIGTGDFFTDYKLVDKATANANAGGKYVKRLVDVANPKYGGGAYLNSDLKLNTSGSWNGNGRALWEKKFEYRRYITEGSTSDPADKYEVVYPVTQKYLKENSTKAPTGLKASIKSTTTYTDDSKTKVDSYIFDVVIKPLKTSKKYTRVEPYVQYLSDANSRDESIGVEPGEDSADAWHNIISRQLVIKTPDGKEVCRKDISSNNATIELSGKAYPSLDNATASLEVTYTTSVRYMKSKETYKTLYTYKGKEYDTPSSVISVVENEKGFISDSKTTISNHYTTSNPRIVKTYVTDTSDSQTLELSDKIDGPYTADPVKPNLELNIDPPNALTKLEGGKFDINMEIDTKGIPMGDSGEDCWISDFKIDSLVVTAENGEIIYEHSSTIDGFNNSNKSVSIRDVTANPTHIGKATVTAKYSYNFNKQKWESPEPIEKPDGSVIYPDKIKGDVITTPHYGTVTAYFNIYSLTGVTA